MKVPVGFPQKHTTNRSGAKFHRFHRWTPSFIRCFSFANLRHCESRDAFESIGIRSIATALPERFEPVQTLGHRLNAAATAGFRLRWGLDWR